MKVTRILLFTIAMVASSHAKKVQVGDKNVMVPEPEGFVEVTPEMKELYAATQKLTDPDYQTLAYYIPSEVAATAKQGKLPALDKYFILKVQENIKFVTMDNTEFGALVSAARSSNQMISDEVKLQLGDSYSEAAALGLKGFVFLPPHRDSEHAFAYSGLLTTKALGSGDKKVLSSTTSYVNAGGKVLLLYGYAGEKDVDWTRAATDKWADTVLESNPVAPVGAPKGGASKFDLGSAGGDGLKSGIIGALVGAIVVLLLVMIKNRKSKA